MSKVVETDAGWFVCTRYDGRKIAGPFATKAEAYQGQEDTPPLVVWQGKERSGYFIANEDTGQQVGSYFKKYEDAMREREKLCPTIRKWGDVAFSPSPALEAKRKRGRPPVSAPEAA